MQTERRRRILCHGRRSGDSVFLWVHQRYVPVLFSPFQSCSCFSLLHLNFPLSDIPRRGQANPPCLFYTTKLQRSSFVMQSIICQTRASPLGCWIRMLAFAISSFSFFFFLQGTKRVEGKLDTYSEDNERCQLAMSTRQLAKKGVKGSV